MISIEEYVGIIDTNEALAIRHRSIGPMKFDSQEKAYRDVGSKEEPYNHIRNLYLTRLILGEDEISDDYKRPI